MISRALLILRFTSFISFLTKLAEIVGIKLDTTPVPTEMTIMFSLFPQVDTIPMTPSANSGV